MSVQIPSQVVVVLRYVETDHANSVRVWRVFKDVKDADIDEEIKKERGRTGGRFKKCTSLVLEKLS